MGVGERSSGSGVIMAAEARALVGAVQDAAQRATSLEEALRAAAALICAEIGWKAARIQFSPEAGDFASRAVWHLETPDQLGSLLSLAEARRGGLGAPLAARVLELGKPAFSVSLATSADSEAAFAFPALLRKRTLAALEFFGDLPEMPAAEALATVERACASLGEIIEKKPAEDSMRRAERDYRDLFESAGEALLVLDAERRVVLDANPRACTLCGWAWPELVGSEVQKLWSGELPPPGEESARFEVEQRRRDGSELRIEVTASPVRWRKQRAFLAMLREVPERERVLSALRASADRDRQLFDKSPQPMWVVDAQTQRLLAVNDAAVRAYGYSRQELLQKRADDLREPLLEQAAEGDQEFSFGDSWAATTQRHRVADGELRDVEVASHDIVHEGVRARLVAITDVTRRRLAQARLLHAAFYDGLTGLPNRALFRERLEVAHARARRTDGARFAVLFLDLDRFKLVNDSLGHEAGDELLAQVARRLEGCRRKSDIVARLGGDEFTVLVEDVKDEAAAVQVAERLHRALGPPFLVRGQEVFARVSIGIALGGPQTERPELLLREADTAMYRAKVSGGRHAVYDRSMQEHALKSLRLENDLRRAIERGELRVYFQPVVQLDTGRTSGVEALVRWEHPSRGLLLPGEFLPTAEATGLILGLGRWVLNEACKQARALPEEVTLSVNLSGHQLLQADLAEQVSGALARSGFPASRLLLELTESTLIETGPAGAARIDELRALGGRLCLDDFGTGYSSLSYLHALPIDALKIDASFVRALGGDRRKIAIVRSILLLGKGLDIDVVAEGVETQDQADLLAELGCLRAQGFLYSRPVPIEVLLG